MTKRTSGLFSTIIRAFAKAPRDPDPNPIELYLTGDPRVQHAEIRGGCQILGRARDCNIAVTNGTVSLNQLMIDWRGPNHGLFITAFKSANGTIFDGEELSVNEPTRIPTDAVLYCGTVQLRFFVRNSTSESETETTDVIRV